MKFTQTLTLISLASLGGAGAAIDFNRDIRPILSENCFHCHGPDKSTREADLRLDTEEGANADLGDGHRVLIPGKPEASELFHRITSTDRDELMPPPESKRKLTPDQKKLLERWIAEGGKYAAHWAYESPLRPELPAGEGSPIDFFIDAALQERGLKANAEADRRTLIRRLSLDLTGLPPTPEEIAAFVTDDSEDAYEKLVDRLLASPRFGERWAVPWLDLARYADSNGFQADQLRDSWAFRDWVIDALNADMPFDQFTIEQIAGDLLPDATPAQRIATGFHRTVTCNVEAGVHPEENRVNQVVDRVTTTGTVWLGVTIGCAQCHDHKYDPFTMKDFYSLFAFFNNTPLEVQNKSGKGVSFDFWGPKMELPLSSEKQEQRDVLQAELTALKSEKAALGKAGSGLAEWENRARKAVMKPPSWQVLSVDRFESNGGEDVEVLDDQSVLLTGRLPGTAVYTLTTKTKLEGISAFKVETLTHDKIPGKGPGRGDSERTNFILNEFGVKLLGVGKRGGREIELHSARADFSQTRWEVAKAIDGDGKTGWAIAPQFGKPHWASFQTGEPLGDGEEITLQFTFDQNYGRGRTIGRLRVSALVGDPAFLDLPKEVVAALKKEPGKRSKKDKGAIAAQFGKSNPGMRKLDAKIAALEKKIAGIKTATTLVMVEQDEARETFVMERGNYLSPGEKVSAATPASLPPLPEGAPKNRLGLARWLVDPANPLVARVTVNRWWAELFGGGIVSTLEDFGTQSEPPSHPKLLDWLAVEFVESGWSMKHILKQMVISEAYRRSSDVRGDALEKDAGNRWLARGPRFRMGAEMIRDNALAASGLLSTTTRGAPVMPYQPPGIWRQVGRNEPKWVEAKNEDRWRRGVYVIWRRAAPYPSFVNFDGPDRGSCVVARPRTNTPLQALTLMNDPAYVEIALAFAERVIKERPGGEFAPRLSHAFELLLAREPSAAETSYLEGVYRERLAQLEANPKLAGEVIAGARGALKLAPAAAASARELAAWQRLSTILLNLDETITKG